MLEKIPQREFAHFKRFEVGGKTTPIPADITLKEPTDAQSVPDKRPLVYIPWEEKYLTRIGSSYQPFFTFVREQGYLAPRTTDVHTAICMPFVQELSSQVASRAGKPVDERVVSLALILRDTGWSQLSQQEIAESLGVKGLALTPGAIGPKEKHAVEGEKIARQMLETYPFDPPLTDAQKTLIAQAVLYHDKPAELATGGPVPLEMQVLCDADHLWSFTHENFWQDTIRKDVRAREYIKNLRQDVDAYFTTPEGRTKATRMLQEREQEVAEMEAQTKRVVIPHHIVQLTIRALGKILGTSHIDKFYETNKHDGEPIHDFVERMWNEGEEIRSEDMIFRNTLKSPEGIRRVMENFAQELSQVDGRMEDMRIPRQLYDQLLNHFDETLFARRFQATHWTEHNMLHALIIMQSTWMAGRYVNLVDKKAGRPPSFSDLDLLATTVAGLIHDTQRKTDVFSSLTAEWTAKHLVQIGEKAPAIMEKHFGFLKELVNEDQWPELVEKVGAIAKYHGPEAGEPGDVYPGKRYEKLVELIRFTDANSLFRTFVSPNKRTSRVFAGGVVGRIMPGKYISKTAMPELTDPQHPSVQHAFIDVERVLDILGTQAIRQDPKHPGTLRGRFEVISAQEQKDAFTQLLSSLGLLSTN